MALISTLIKDPMKDTKEVQLINQWKDIIYYIY